jgi:tRNA(Ile)-lysidine synthase
MSALHEAIPWYSMDLTKTVLTSLRYYGMSRKGDKVMVAVSGGPDSVCLLHILNRIKDSLGIKLSVAHLDHGIRGSESRRDAGFVKRLAKKEGLPFFSKRIRSPGGRSGLSLEEALRAKRYEFLKRSCKKAHAHVLATAHTLDDQAETVLMRVLKGSSMKGLVGIHPVFYDGDLRIIRPLIQTEKQEILTYCADQRIGYRTDRTNRENRFLRNRIRNRIIPYLESVNPRLKRTLSQIADSLREDFAFIEAEKKKKSRMVRRGKGGASILLCDIVFQPKALQREIMREALMRSGANIKRLTFRHWKDIDTLIREKAKGKSMHVPGGLRIRKTRDRLIISK